MLSDDNKRLVRHYYEEVVNTGRVDEIARFIAPHYVEVHENKRYSIGLNGAKEFTGSPPTNRLNPTVGFARGLAGALGVTHSVERDKCDMGF